MPQPNGRDRAEHAKPEGRTSEPGSRPEEQFRSFVTNSVGFVVALVAAIPMLADWAKLVQAPVLSSVAPQLAATLATASSAILFLGLFWLRAKVARPRYVFPALLVFIVGCGLLVFSQIHDLGSTVAPVSKYVAFVLSFPVGLGGAAVVFLFGFVRYSERAELLQSLLPRLETVQWNTLLEFAQTQVRIRDALESPKRLPRVRDALKRSAESLVSDYGEILARLRSGQLEIRGPRMDELFENFAGAVQRQFRAISRDDLPYWLSPESERYLEINRRLLAEGPRIERVFLLKRGERLNDDHLVALKKQLGMGIQLRIGFLEDTKEIVDDDRELDFGLLDDFAVSFWRISSGRVFKISTAPGDCRRYTWLFEKVVKICQSIPGKDGEQKTLASTEAELEGLVRKSGLWQPGEPANNQRSTE